MLNPNDKDSWMPRAPWVAQDPEFKREWLSPEPLRYYVHQSKEGEWMIIDRWWDLAHGEKYRTREAAIRAFYKSFDRRIPTGTKLSRCEGSKYAG
jgi:hypothetical protein